MIKKDFLDKRHEKVQDRYFEIACDELEIVETQEDLNEILKELQKLIKIDPNFLDSYNLMAEILRDDLGRDKEAAELEKQAYDIALATITDKKGNWPKSLIWGYLENRHIIRAIDRWAFTLWRRKQTNQALEIFRQLLHANLGDNVGARFSILAIRMGMKPDYDEKWAVEHGIDAGQLLQWWDKNYRNYMDEFREWEKEWGDTRHH